MSTESIAASLRGPQTSPVRSEPAARTEPRSLPQPAQETAQITANRPMDTAVQRAVQQLFEGRNVDVRSFHDEKANRVVYRVVDAESGEVILQSPPDELLHLYASFRQQAEGSLLRIQV